jgi:hypothetical protein
MDLSYVFGMAATLMIVGYGIMICYMLTQNLNLPGLLDTSGYSLSTPIAIGLSGFVLACVAGIFAYAQINTQSVFTASIILSCIVLALTTAALGITAITH